MAKLLLVEDNPENRDMLSRRLMRRGFELCFAVDGAEAVSCAHEQRPDLVLMDLSLPVMDGWEATRRIKADPDTRGIPIIALTAHAIAGDREKALVSRFRRLYLFAACTFTNVGTKGTLATH